MIIIGLAIAAFVIGCILVSHKQKRPRVRQTVREYTANGHRDRVTYDGRFWVTTNSVDKTRIKSHRKG